MYAARCNQTIMPNYVTAKVRDCAAKREIETDTDTQVLKPGAKQSAVAGYH